MPYSLFMENVEFRRIVALLQQHTADIAPSSPLCIGYTEDATNTLVKPAAMYRTSNIVVDKKTHQAHVMMGTRGYSVHDERRIALYLLNNILGGSGMSTRLNLSLRERNGLVYTVESTFASFSAMGMWSTYFGCDPQDTDKCISLVRQEFDKIMQEPLSTEELDRAKHQIKGQIGIACDSRENFALDFGKSFLHYGWEKRHNKSFMHKSMRLRQLIFKTWQKICSWRRNLRPLSTNKSRLVR